MSISETQKEQVVKNFYLLCETFLPSEEIRKNIKVVFQEQDIEGWTFYQAQESKFVVSFWDQEYQNQDLLLRVVAHEFTHVIFFLNQGKHTHDWIFFLYVETFWHWLKFSQKY